MKNDLNIIDTSLYKAYKDYNLLKVKKWLKKGGNPNMLITEDGKTLFMKVVFGAENRFVKVMLKYNADIHLVDKKWGHNAYLFACRSGRKSVVKTLIKAGSDIFSVGNDNDNVLMLSAYSNKYKMIKFFCEKGIDINAQNNSGQTALIYALSRCNVEKNRSVNLIEPKTKTIIELLKHGADINLSDNNGNTPLVYAAEKGCLSLTSLLLNNRADVNASKDNILHLAENKWNKHRNYKEIRSLLKRFGAKNPPFSIKYKLNIFCYECGKFIPLNAPFLEIKCPHCYTFVKLEKLRDNFWDTIFEGSARIKGSFWIENVFYVELERTAPLCSKCDTELNIANYEFGTNKDIICEKCGEKNSSFPVPEWMKNNIVNDFKAKQIFCAEKEGDDKNINQEQKRTIAFKCNSCAATMSISADTPRNCICKHCGATQYLLDPLWLALHPVKTRKAWYIYFGE